MQAAIAARKGNLGAVLPVVPDNRDGETRRVKVEDNMEDVDGVTDDMDYVGWWGTGSPQGKV
jgi:hypothetical protein